MTAWQAPRNPVTPHARGSTLPLLSGAVLYTGYPACAGIDLGRWVLNPRRKRLPRMRGDRPLPPAGSSGTLGATPHARGSTVPRLTGHASSLWLPRMRGDRPFSAAGRFERIMATPHARGSTSGMAIVGERGPGYHACAGIDLLVRCRETLSPRLPRMRGDRPARLIAAAPDM